MSNSKNKILPYAQSAIEGQNIQSQAEYLSSTEREDGVKTGIANGDNFNKFAKQVALMCSSLAEYIVNNTDEGDLTDNLSVDQIATLMEKAIVAKQQKIEFMTQENYDRITPDPKTLYMIESEPFPNVFAKSLNGVTPDGTGDIKYQIVKTVNTKAPDSDGNVQLEFTFSPDINTGLTGYPLSMENGGLGKPLLPTDASGILWYDLSGSETDLNSIIKAGIYRCSNWRNYPSGVALINQGILFNYMYAYNSSSQYWGTQLFQDVIGNLFYRTSTGATYSEWKNIRRADGSIPTELSGTPLVYTNSYGTWTETKLSDGTTMLEGCGSLRLMPNENKNITVPKSFNTSKGFCIMAQEYSNTDVYNSISVSYNFGQGFTVKSVVTTSVVFGTFYFKGILA